MKIKTQIQANMKARVLLKVISFVMVCIFVVMSIVSCASKAAKEVTLELNGTKIQRDIYEYWLSYYKSYYLNAYSDVEDTEESWNREIEGLTVREHVINDATRKLKNILCALYLYKENNLSLSSAEKHKIEEDIEAAIEYFETKSNMNKVLNNLHGFTSNRLGDIYEMEAKALKLQDYLYGKNGVEKVTDDDIENFYNENYSLVKMIYLNKKYNIEYDEDGHAKVNPNGSYVYSTKELTDAEKAQNMQKAEQALARAKDGENFDELIEEYSDLSKDYFTDTPNGYYVVPYETDQPIPMVFLAALDMEVGETRLEYNDFIICVIQKVPLREKAYNDSKDFVQFANIETYCINDKFSKKLNELYDDITVNEDVVNSITFFDIKENFQFYYYKKD